MHKLFLATALSTGLALAAPLSADARGFDSDIQTQLTTPVKIEVVLSEDMAHRANNLPKKLRDRSNTISFNNGFGGNGFYGEKDLNRLVRYTEEKLVERFEKRGIVVSDTAPVIMRVTLKDARPNRPTFRQLSKQPNLSYNSIGIGGAEISAEIIAAGGSSLGTMNYDWFETDISYARFGGTWSDAQVAIRRFAKRAAKELKSASSS